MILSTGLLLRRAAIYVNIIFIWYFNEKNAFDGRLLINGKLFLIVRSCFVMFCSVFIESDVFQKVTMRSRVFIKYMSYFIGIIEQLRQGHVINITYMLDISLRRIY